MANEIGSDLGLTLPTPEVTAGPDWAESVNTALQSHTDAIEAGVRTAIGLTVDSDVVVYGYELQVVGALTFDDKSVAYTPASSLYQRDGNLFYNDGDGNQIQFTDGGVLNAASLGGIVGDYGGADPAKVTYVNSTATYIFTQDPNVPARIDVGDIKLRETGATSPNAITIQSPAALAAAYTLTLLTALPASTSLLQVSSAGAISSTRDPSITTLTTSGAIQGLSVTGTSYVSTPEADIRHGTRAVVFTGAQSFSNQNGNVNMHDHDSSAGCYLETTGSDKVWIPIEIAVADTLEEVKVRILDTGASAVDLRLFEINTATGGVTQRGTTQTSAADGSDQSLTITGLSLVPTLSKAFVMCVRFGAASQRLYGGYYLFSKS